MIRQAWKRSAGQIWQSAMEMAGDRLGIIGPHADEFELVLNGAKPFALVGAYRRDHDAILQAISEKKIYGELLDVPAGAFLDRREILYFRPDCETLADTMVDQINEMRLLQGGPRTAEAEARCRQINRELLTLHHTGKMHLFVQQDSMPAVGFNGIPGAHALEALVEAGLMRKRSWPMTERMSLWFLCQPEHAILMPEFRESHKPHLMAHVFGDRLQAHHKATGLPDFAQFLGYTKADQARWAGKLPKPLERLAQTLNTEMRKARVAKMKRLGKAYQP